MALVVIAKCGHPYKEVESIDVWGRKFKIRLPTDEPSELCHKCLAEKTIFCAWCGKLIFPGDKITLDRESPKKKAHKNAKLYRGLPRLFIGCADENCIGFNPASILHVYAGPGNYKQCLMIEEVT